MLWPLSLTALLVITGCSGNETTAARPSTQAAEAEEKAPPRKTHKAPVSRYDLAAMLVNATPERTIALKGELRSQEGQGILSFERVAVVGASLSAGFGGLALSSAFEEAIAGEHEVFPIASTFFFRSPNANGKAHIDQAIAAKASVIVAVDLLFWYVYQNTSLEGRQDNLETGLRNLERIKVPLILGDIPDMRTGEPWMLPPAAIPPPEQLLLLNTRVHQWARQRQHVHLVPLAQWSAALASDGDIEVDVGKPPVPAKSLVNVDGLHPNPKGVRYILLRLDSNLQIAFPETSPDALVF